MNAVHPGSINSRFGRDGDTGALSRVLAVFGRLVLRSPKVGARTSVLLAGSDALRVVGSTGGYFSHGRRWPASRRVRDPQEARWLWDHSERLVADASAPTPGVGP